MGEIKILKKGLLTSIQDLGRFNYQSHGVPISGVMDEYAYKIANLLLENDFKKPVLEITYLGPKIQFLCDTVISITGGDLNPRINGKEINMWESVNVKKDDILSFKGVKKGVRSYIAIANGLNIPKIMGSFSYYSKANIGIEIKDNQILKFNEKNNRLTKRKLPLEYIPDYKKEITCRVLLGPQDDFFTQDGLKTFLTSKYKITNQADRMGYRLEGKKIEHKKTADIISEPLKKGAIQVPGNGQPIIMMSDAQTTGGYSKIGYVLREDLSKLSQLGAGSSVSFEKVSIDIAQKSYKNWIKKFDLIKKNIANAKEYNIRVNGKEYYVTVEKV